MALTEALGEGPATPGGSPPGWAAGWGPCSAPAGVDTEGILVSRQQLREEGSLLGGGGLALTLTWPPRRRGRAQGPGMGPALC